MDKNKVTMIWYCRHGKFRITAEEERQMFSQRGDDRHPMVQLQETRKAKQKNEIADL